MNDDLLAEKISNGHLMGIAESMLGEFRNKVEYMDDRVVFYLNSREKERINFPFVFLQYFEFKRDEHYCDV